MSSVETERNLRNLIYTNFLNIFDKSWIEFLIISFFAFNLIAASRWKGGGACGFIHYTATRIEHQVLQASINLAKSHIFLLCNHKYIMRSTAMTRKSGEQNVAPTHTIPGTIQA